VPARLPLAALRGYRPAPARGGPARAHPGL